MNDDLISAVGSGRLNWLLDDLVRRVGPIGRAVILSADGLALAGARAKAGSTR